MSNKGMKIHSEKHKENLRQQMKGNKFSVGRIPWNKGLKCPEISQRMLGAGNHRFGTEHSLEWKNFMSKRMEGVGNGYFGKKHTEEIKDKMRGENNGGWKGGITPENKLIRSSREYALWREIILKKDNYKCVDCGIKRGWNKELKIRIKLEIHHIKPFSLFPELRLAIDNGISLCKTCHSKTPTYGINKQYAKTL